MTPKSKSRLPIYVGAWLATAVATFCLGRITSGPSHEAKGGAKGNARGDSSTSALSGNAGASGAAGASSEDLIARVFGSHATSLDQVLGGKTLDEHLKNLLKVDDEAVRMLGFLRLLEALNNPEDIKAALEVIGKEGNGRFRITESSMLLQKWASIDPKEAAAFASAQRDFSRFTGMNAVLRTWLKSNPEEAIAWAEANGVQQRDENDRGPGRGGPEDGNVAIATLIGPLAQQNLDRAFELTKNQPESRARSRMIDTLVDEMLAQRGADAVRNAIADLPDDAFRAGMAGQLVDKLMRNADPKDVATQAWGFPSGETRERAMSEVISRIADKDPVAAGTLLQTFGNSPDLDSAKASFSREVLRQDPSSAFVWAGTITNDQE
ncbi:MAG TPA: hypothetical protein VFG14_00980, partial [Chthoniobacteraceae bacterium]|nr:hypothetical protein [Chthoniobacteraceae bacterium]